MKAASFDYVLADSLTHALALLHEAGGDAKLLAGGQSLVPMMAMRLAQPAQLIDINRLAELKQIAVAERSIEIGAAVRQCDAAAMDSLAEQLPLLHKAMPWVGHQQTRNRGTIGGSLVHADPSAELPLVALVLNARLRLISQAKAERRLLAEDFFVATMQSAAADDECLTDIEWPVWSGERISAAFDEVAIRKGDFAIASAACQMQLDAAGRIERLAFGLGGVAPTALAFPQLAQQLIGQRPSVSALGEVAQQAALQCDADSDLHASADYRRHLARVLLERVLRQALAERLPETEHG